MDDIRQYLPQPKDTRLIQVRIDKKLIDEARVLIKSGGYTWNQVIEACLKRLVEELKQK
jgi:antitoxin component of RelBE/YafQ-DinJ toxin-antitoxin module